MVSDKLEGVNCCIWLASKFFVVFEAMALLPGVMIVGAHPRESRGHFRQESAAAEQDRVVSCCRVAGYGDEIYFRDIYERMVIGIKIYGFTFAHAAHGVFALAADGSVVPIGGLAQVSICHGILPDAARGFPRTRFCCNCDWIVREMLAGRLARSSVDVCPKAGGRFDARCVHFEFTSRTVFV